MMCAERNKISRNEPKHIKLAEILIQGTELHRDSKFIGPQLVVGTFSLTISERDGKKFKGVYAASSQTADGPGLNVEVEGLITGDRIRFVSINSARNIVVIGGRKGEALQMQFTNELNHKYALSVKLPL